MSRQNFTPVTKKIIAARAGWQCSFPTCNRMTTGPGANATEMVSSGEACHIYSAAKGGPRGQKNLTQGELIRAENGIWLCNVHSSIVDSNRGRRFPPELLTIYKRLQEARVQREQQGLYVPLGWLHELTIESSPLSSIKQTVWFAKLNLFYGDIATGKSAVLKWVRQMLGDGDARWKYAVNDLLECELTYLDPEVVQIGITIAGEQRPQFRFKGKDSAFNPVNVKFICPTRPQWHDRCDDAEVLGECLGIEPRLAPNSFLTNLFTEVQSFKHAHIRNLRFTDFLPEDGERRNCLVLDCDGCPPGLTLRGLSGGQQERVIIELATAIARVSGRYTPTVLILDHLVDILFQGWFDFYSHHFLDPENMFQTFLCLPRLPPEVNLDQVQENGWEVVGFAGEWGNIIISQPQLNTRATQEPATRAGH